MHNSFREKPETCAVEYATRRRIVITVCVRTYTATEYHVIITRVRGTHREPQAAGLETPRRRDNRRGVDDRDDYDGSDVAGICHFFLIFLFQLQSPPPPPRVAYCAGRTHHFSTVFIVIDFDLSI